MRKNVEVSRVGFQCKLAAVVHGTLVERKWDSLRGSRHPQPGMKRCERSHDAPDVFRIIEIGDGDAADYHAGCSPSLDGSSLMRSATFASGSGELIKRCHSAFQALQALGGRQIEVRVRQRQVNSELKGAFHRPCVGKVVNKKDRGRSGLFCLCACETYIGTRRRCPGWMEAPAR